MTDDPASSPAGNKDILAPLRRLTPATTAILSVSISITTAVVLLHVAVIRFYPPYDPLVVFMVLASQQPAVVMYNTFGIWLGGAAAGAYLLSLIQVARKPDAPGSLVMSLAMLMASLFMMVFTHAAMHKAFHS